MCHSDMITFKQWRTIKKWAKTSVQFGFEVFALFTFLSEWFAGIYIVYRIWNEFSFHTVFMKRVLCFYIPEPLAKGYKTHNECHKYRMKWFIPDSFYHMFHPQKREKNRVFFSILLRKNATTSGRYLWCLRRTATFQPIKMLPGAMS